MMRLISLFGSKQRNGSVSLTSGQTPLHFAAEENEEVALEEHISRGCEVNAVDERGNTALHVAARKGHVSIIKVLLRHRAEPDTRNRDGKLPLDLAKKARREFAVVVLEAAMMQAAERRRIEQQQAAERQRIEQQVKLAEAQNRAMQRSNVEDAVKLRSQDRVKAATERREVIDKRREELKQIRAEAEVQSRTRERMDRVRKDSSASASRMVRKLSFSRRKDNSTAPPAPPAVAAPAAAPAGASSAETAACGRDSGASSGEPPTSTRKSGSVVRAVMSFGRSKKGRAAADSRGEAAAPGAAAPNAAAPDAAPAPAPAHPPAPGGSPAPSGSTSLMGYLNRIEGC